MNDRETSLEQLKQRVARFVAQRDWQKYHRPKNLAMSLAVEAAELMEHFQWVTHEEADAMLRRPRARREVCEELADILAFLLSLANAVGIDLASAFEAKMRRNERKYPAAKVRGNYRRPRRRKAR